MSVSLGGYPEGEKILARLSEPDPTSLYWTSLGLGGPLPPALAAQIFESWLALTHLVDAVPADVRDNFERVRKLFLHGIFEYGFFALADHETHLVLEGALRHRFVSFYDHEVPVWRDGQSSIINAHTFNAFYDTVARLRRQRPKVQLQLRVGERAEPLPLSYRALYGWAERRKLLVGRRNVGVFGSIVRLRNDVAHPEGHWIDMPPDVIRLMRDAAEIINKLWGADTDGGRLFPGPVKRQVRCAALAPDRTAAVTFGSLQILSLEERTKDWTFAAFLAAEAEDLIDFDLDTSGVYRFKHLPGFQATDYPAEQVWGPGRLEDLIEFLESLDAAAAIDSVAFQDRFFFVRTTPEQTAPDLPRAVEDVLERPVEEDSQETEWYVLQADFPKDAWATARDLHQGSAGSPHAQAVETIRGDTNARKRAQQLLEVS